MKEKKTYLELKTQMRLKPLPSSSSPSFPCHLPLVPVVVSPCRLNVRGSICCRLVGRFVSEMKEQEKGTYWHRQLSGCRTQTLNTVVWDVATIFGKGRKGLRIFFSLFRLTWLPASHCYDHALSCLRAHVVDWYGFRLSIQVNFKVSNRFLPHLFHFYKLFLLVF